MRPSIHAASRPPAPRTPRGLIAEDPWRVCDWAYPAEGSTAEQLTFLLNYAVLAPSVHNTQPWIFKIVSGEVELYADRQRGLPVMDPHGRALVMSCGAALLNLRVAMRHFGHLPIVHTFPDLDDPDLLAFIRMGRRQPPSLHDSRLFTGIKQRHTNRGPFEPRPVPEAEQARLQCAAQHEGASLHLIENPAEKEALAALIAEGDRLQGSNALFRRELAQWVHTNRTDSHDGMPGYALGIGDVASYAGPLVLRTFDWGDGRAAHDRQLAEGSPLLAVLTTEADNAPAWLEAGQALGRVLLAAQAYGLQVSFLNQPVEVPTLRAQLAAHAGGAPQAVLRIGYGHDAPPTPRRPVNHVLSTSRYR